MNRWLARKTRRSRARFERLESRTLLAADPIISEFMAANRGGIEDGNGNASDWIEIANRGDAAINLGGWYLTDDATRPSKFALPNRTLEPGAFLIVFASAPSDGQGGIANDYVDEDGNPHANFQLSKEGEYLALVEPDATTIVNSFSPAYPDQVAGVSYGLDNASSDAGFLVEPTPGETNGTIASGIVSDTKFDFDRGFYDGAIRRADPIENGRGYNCLYNGRFVAFDRQRHCRVGC